MNLINMKEVSKIVGLDKTAIRKKVVDGTFPNHKSKEHNSYMWREKDVIKWLSVFENKVMRLHELGKISHDIARTVNSNKAIVNRTLEKYKLNENLSRLKESTELVTNGFQTVLNVSANLTNNRGQ